MKGLLKRNKKTFIFMTSLLLFLIGVGVIQEIVKNLKPFEDVPVVSVETKDENKNQGSEVLKKPVNDDVKVSKGFYDTSLDDKKLEDRIDDIIEDYYRRLNKGSSTVVGVTPADRLRDELDDLVHTISPHLEKQVWVKFFLDLPNDKFTMQDFISLQEDHLIVVKTCILTIIKSSNLWVKISIMMKNKGKGNKSNDPTNQTIS